MRLGYYWSRVLARVPLEAQTFLQTKIASALIVRGTVSLADESTRTRRKGSEGYSDCECVRGEGPPV